MSIIDRAARDLDSATAKMDGAVDMLAVRRKIRAEKREADLRYTFDDHVLNLDFAPKLREFVDFIAETGPKKQPALALAAVLSLAGTLVGRKVQTETGLRTNLYFCGLADSGYGKNHARKIVSQLLADENNGTAGMLSMKLGTGAGIVSLLAENQCKLFLHDEFGLFLQQISRENAPKYWRDVNEVLNDMFSEADGVYHSTATKLDGAVVIEQPNLSIYGTSTPKEFFESLTKTMLSSGLIARMLFVPGDKTAALRLELPECVIPDEIRTHVRAVLAIDSDREMLLGHMVKEKAKTIRFTAESRAAWNDYRLRMDAMMRKHDDSGFSSIYNRAAEHAAKIALAVACFELHDVISLPVLSWAIRFVDNATTWLIDALRVNLSENLHEQQAKRILELVAKLGGTVTRSDITRRTKWLDKRARDSILTDLVESGELTSTEIPSDGTHKNTTVYRLA